MSLELLPADNIRYEIEADDKGWEYIHQLEKENASLRLKLEQRALEWSKYTSLLIEDGQKRIEKLESELSTIELMAKLRGRDAAESMRGSEFASMLKESGYTQRSFAKLMKVHRNTIAAKCQAEEVEPCWSYALIGVIAGLRKQYRAEKVSEKN